MNKREDTESLATIGVSGIIGLLTGFTAAILLAPKSGNELRETFWSKIDELNETLDEDLKDRGIL